MEEGGGRVEKPLYKLKLKGLMFEVKRSVVWFSVASNTSSCRPAFTSHSSVDWESCSQLTCVLLGCACIDLCHQ